MGKKRKLEDREIQKIVAREKILNISKRKLKKVKIFNTLYINIQGQATPIWYMGSSFR